MKEGGMDKACSMYEREEMYIQCFGRKSEGRRPVESLECRWEDNVAVDLREIGWEDVYWISLA
jgi:hypothetical protein